MTLQIILAVITASLVIALAYYYLNWKAMLWLGGLFTAVCALALFLNYQNDGITFSIPVGDGLFRRGDSVSILGDYQWLAVAGFLAGAALMIAGAVKRIRIPVAEPTLSMEEPFTEKEKIEQALDAEIEKVQNELDDPSERGRQDAHEPGGAIPHRHATAPKGFESTTYERYQRLGNSFVQNTVTRLKAEIEEALRKLNILKATLAENYYAKKAGAGYSENRDRPDYQHVDDLRTEVGEAGRDRQQFIQDLNLRKGQQPEWDKPTSTKQLIMFGAMFALVEFLVSYYFLKDEIGESRAITIALYAMTVIFVLAAALAGLFKFMRPPNGIPMRVLTGAGYAVLLFLLTLGFGLLLEYREVEAKLSSGEVAGVFKTILDGYISVLTSLGNLTLFLINLIAFGLFYWKFLLWCERFYGYRRIGDRINQSKSEWHAMFSNNSTSIKNALDKASSEASDNRIAAQQAVKNLQDKKHALANIQTIIAPAFVNKLHPAYDGAINAYRTSNKEHRNLQVNPAPPYFNNAPDFCSVEEYFSSDHGIDDFMSQRKQDITKADETCQQIEHAVTEWQNQRAQISPEWADEFRNEINGDRIS